MFGGESFLIQVRKQYGNIYVRILDNMETFEYTLEKIRNIRQRSFKASTGEWMFPQETIEDLLHEFGNQIVWMQPLEEIVKDLPVKQELVTKHLKWKDEHDFKNWLLQPYGYQKVGAHFLADRGNAAIFDGVGLGKTNQVLGSCQILFNQGKAKQALIVTLSSIKRQWAKEVTKFMGESAIPVYGIPSQREKQMKQFKKDKSCRFLIINYEMLRNQKYLKLIHSMNFDIVALDEAQKIKTGVTDKMLNLNPSQNAEGAYKLTNIPYRIIATATPIQSKAEEIWSLYHFINEDILGPWEYFRERYCKYHPRFGINGYQNEGELYYRIAPHFIRRTKEMPEIQQQLPKVKHDHIFLETTATQEKIESYLLDKIEEIKDQSRSSPPKGKVINGQLMYGEQLQEYYDGLIQGYTSFLLTNTDSPELFKMSESSLAHNMISELSLTDNEMKKSPKLEQLIDFFKQLEHDEPNAKVVIFSRFERMVRLIYNQIPNSVMYSGEISERDKEYAKEQFVNNPYCKVFVGTDSASTGLNLQVAAYLIHIDMPWDPTMIEQRNGRIDRTGNPNPNITIMYYVMGETYEEDLIQTLERKASLASSILEGGRMKPSSQDFTKLALNKMLKRKEKAKNRG